MAVMELGSVSYGTTGNKSITLNGSETPSYVDFWVGPPSGTSTANMESIGALDVTNAIVTWQSNYTDGTGSQTKSGAGTSTTTPCVQHWNRIGGVLTKVVDWTFVSVAAGTLTINVNSVVASSSNYSVYFRIYG